MTTLKRRLVIWKGISFYMDFFSSATRKRLTQCLSFTNANSSAYLRAFFFSVNSLLVLIVLQNILTKAQYLDEER